MDLGIALPGGPLLAESYRGLHRAQPVTIPPSYLMSDLCQVPSSLESSSTKAPVLIAVVFVLAVFIVTEGPPLNDNGNVERLLVGWNLYF